MASSTLKTALMTSVYQGKDTKNYEYATRHGLGQASNGTVIEYVYFTNPVPKGATVMSAKLFLYTDAATGSSAHTMTLKRLSKSVKMTKVTWKTRPTTYYATPAPATLTKTAPFAAGSEWAVDVTAHFQALAAGEAWYGWEVTGNSSPARNVYGPRWSTAAQRPRLEITWAMIPQAPASLSPGGARLVGLPKPVLRATYTDVGADNPLGAVQVQRNDASGDFSGAVTWDSGIVASSTAQLDTATTSWPALTSSTPVYWRMRVQDVNGLWSLWSSAESFGYDPKAPVDFINPGAAPNNFVTEDSPPIVWQFPSVGSEKTTNGNVSSLSYFTTVNGTGGTSALSLLTGGAADGTNAARQTWSVATTAASSAGMVYSVSNTTPDPGLSVVPGQQLDVKANVRPSVAQTIVLGAAWYDASGTLIGTPATSSTAVAAGAWSAVTLRTPVAPSNAVRVRLHVYGTSAVWPVGGTLDVSNLSVLLADVSGKVQTAYQVFLIDPVSGAQVWTSGKITSASTTGFSLPPGYLKTLGATYRVVVYVWDQRAREATPGDAAYSSASRDFTYALSSTVPPTTTLSAAPDPVRPLVSLTWSRSTFPDSFTVLRNGVVIATELLPSDVALSATTFAYLDPAPLPGLPATYQVAAVVNGKSSSGNSTAVATVNTQGMWLADQQRTLEVLIVGREDRSWTYGEQSEVLEVIGSSSVVVVTHGQRGLEGTVSGQLRSGMFGLPQTAADWKAALLALKAKAATGAQLWLTAGDATIPVVIRQVNVVARPEPQLSYNVSFDFYQTTPA